MRKSIFIVTLLALLLFTVVPVVAAAPLAQDPSSTMTPERLGAIAGVLLSLIFSYVPGLSDKFAALDSTQKSLVMAGLLVLTALGAFALSCGQLVNVVECSQAGAMTLFSTFIAALVANQGTYLISPHKKVTL
jgi:hypothetical protein